MKQPNILFIMTDQQRRQALGFWNNSPYKEHIRDCGDNVHTPNINKLADESVVFSQAVSNCPICSPYRGMLFSGKFPSGNGVAFNCKAGRTSSLDENITTMTDVLSHGGYDIGYIGKYHLDMPETHFDENRNYVGDKGEFYVDGSQKGDESCWDMITPPGAKRHGIDYWYSYGTFDQHQNPHYWDSKCGFHEPKKWSPTHEADKAISYIENSEKQRDLDNPFCLFLSLNPPHSPYDSIEYTDKSSYEEFYSENVADISSLLNRPNVSLESDADKMVRFYFSHVTGVDREVGRVLDAIEELGYKDDTIVIYTSDHGEMMGSQGLLSKNQPYEESYLIPLIIRYPQLLKPRVEDLMIGVPDMMPSLLNLAQLKEAIPKKLDGTDYSDIIINGISSGTKRPLSTLYIHHYNEYQMKGVRTERYTFVIKRDNDGSFKNYVLFDNLNDPYQMNKLEYDDIDKNDLIFLKKELGYWLKKSRDDWYIDRVFEDFIIYDHTS